MCISWKQVSKKGPNSIFGRTINNSEEKENSIGDAPSSIGEVITQLTSFYKTAIKLFAIYLGGVFLIISILDKVLDFDGHESFTLNGIEYETP